MTTPSFRLIIPRFPAFNEYARTARSTTALGPILTATAATQTPGWAVEVIDENNLRRLPHRLRDKNSINHRKLQEVEPASVVGFCVDWSVSAPRAFELADIYNRLGALTIAGGHHVRQLPEEALRNGIDVVILGEGESIIAEILKAYAELRQEILDCGMSGSDYDLTALLTDRLSAIAGIAFIDSAGQMVVNSPIARQQNCQQRLQPNFGLLHYAKVDVYPLQWRRGCPFNCGFCTAEKKSSAAKPQELLDAVKHYAENFGATDFFVVDDYFGGRDAETKEALRLLIDYHELTGRKLSFNIQTQLSACLDEELLELLRRAKVKRVRFVYRPPIKQELESQYSYNWLNNAVYYTKLWRRAGFKVHGLFMFAYPYPTAKISADAVILDKGDGNYLCPKVPLADQERQTKKFIRRLRLDELSISLAVPVPGTELRRQLEQAGCLLDLPWHYYDGGHPLYQSPDYEPEELYQALNRIKKSFRNWRYYARRLLSGFLDLPHWLARNLRQTFQETAENLEDWFWHFNANSHFSRALEAAKEEALMQRKLQLDQELARQAANPNG